MSLSWVTTMIVCPWAVQLLQDGHDLLAALAVQRPRRFIGQDHRPAVHERPRDADALLLAARELIGVVLRAGRPVRGLAGSRWHAPTRSAFAMPAVHALALPRSRRRLDRT